MLYYNSKAYPPSVNINLLTFLVKNSRTKLSGTSIFLKCAKKLSVKSLPCSRSRPRISRSLIINVLAYFTEDVVVTAAVIAMLVSVSSEPVDDFLVLNPLTLLLSITADVLSGGVKTFILVSTAKI